MTPHTTVVALPRRSTCDRDRDLTIQVFAEPWMRLRPDSLIEFKTPESLDPPIALKSCPSKGRNRYNCRQQATMIQQTKNS